MSSDDGLWEFQIGIGTGIKVFGLTALPKLKSHGPDYVVGSFHLNHNASTLHLAGHWQVFAHLYAMCRSSSPIW